MAYTGFLLPNASAAAFPIQAELFAQDIQVIAEAFRDNGVLNGCAVSQRGAGANMSVDVAAGNIVREGATVVVAGGNLVISAAHASLPRIDIVSANNVGALVATAGTAAAVPEPPIIPQVSNINNIVLAFVYIPAADTAVNTNQITDKRAFVTASGAVGTGTVTTSGTPASGNLTQFSGSTVITNGNLSGNVTTAGTLVTTIAAQAVTYARIQNVSAASRLLGRGAAGGAGSPEEIILGTNLTMSGTTLNATGGTGSVPTGTGFTHITAGAQDGAAKLVDTADVNNAQITYAKLQNVSAASKLLGRGDSGSGVPQEITLGANLTMTGTTLAAAAGTGGDFSSNTATSVDSEVVVFSGTLGKTGKRATGTGVARLASGVLSGAELSGDVTTSGSNAATIAGNAVSYAKMQDVAAASRLLGRGSAAGAGDPQEITLGTNLTMSGTTLNASGSGGSIVVRKNTGADVGTRPRLNLIEGSNVTLTVADDAGSNEVDITIASAGGSGGPVLAVMASDVTVNNSTTLVDATGLIVAIGASATEAWWFEVALLLNAVSAAADWKVQWTVPTGASILWGPDFQGSTSIFFGSTTTGNVPASLMTAANVFSVGAATNPHAVIFKGWIFGGGTAGNVQLKFAQLMAVASNYTIKAGSHTRATKVLA